MLGHPALSVITHCIFDTRNGSTGKITEKSDNGVIFYEITWRKLLEIQGEAETMCNIFVSVK